ncbi:type VII secretion integral membrane protein EccD [[Mycobacterium] kokjensenii]|uniref:Type VII secretion integral membrane protein EccD n=1 Tax=[Mycobacterium] kokjensenii TaxID=3064287 RepID=A0ABM9LF09_9MYCO|nr:type VII secretion integral membrane protein EccD [Mycolicibacter sp. MU0083]CAJ1497911.1 type VII secretion integral membrane protein EccD [Mycolicibacter sp. MU0083]
MTAAIEGAQAGGELAPSGPRAVVVGVMAGEGIQIGTLLDADAPVSVMLDPLLKVINGRLRELEEPALEAEGRGRWVLCLVDGTALRPNQSLTEQEVYDGDRLWLRFIEDREKRSPVIEHISTAVSVNLAKRFAPVDAKTAVRVGVSTLVLGVLLATGLLSAWRVEHEGWLTAGFSAGLAFLVLIAAALILMQARNASDRWVGDVMLASGLVPLVVAAAAAVPGEVGAAHAALGFGVAGIAALAVIRLTGRQLAAYSAVAVISVAVMFAGVLRMLFLTGAVTLMTCVYLASVLAYQWAPSLSRWFAGLRLPVFPSATSRWVFEARPDLPTTVVSTPGSQPTLEGPESIREVVLRAERARSFLTGLLTGLGVLTAVCMAGLCDPHTDRPWLPVLLAGLTAGFLVLRGRSFRDRWQAVTVTLTGLVIVAAVVVRFVVVVWTPTALVVGVAVVVLVPMFGLLSAVIVPNTIYSPLFRKFVEWIEYLCLMPLFPLALWLMNTYEAIRYR